LVERVILHAGTPKTGTTSLQVYLARKRDELARRGLIYPPTDGGPSSKPKHQWLVGALMAPDGREFKRRLELLLNTQDAHTLILSTEGLFHHWWDFSKGGREALRWLGEVVPVGLMVWFREPVEFVRSNYIQMLKNPTGFVPCYGRDLSIEQVLDDPWFARHLDYVGFVRDAERLLGAGTVMPFAYDGDTIGLFLAATGVSDVGAEALNEHPTMGAVGTELLRVLNRRELDVEQKRKAVELIGRLDAMLGPASERLVLSEDTERRIRDLSQASVRALAEDFGIRFDSA
jgi:hypothetical protein